MLENASPLKTSQLNSMLAGTSKIKPGRGGHRRSTIAGLMLTSLVDAFSILVIFLIMNTSNSQDIVNVGEKLKLPHASESQFIQDGVVVRVEDSKFLVEEKQVSTGMLIAELKRLNASVEEKKREGLIIVADRNLDYESLSPVILAGSQAGFTKFKFAVLRKN